MSLMAESVFNLLRFGQEFKDLDRVQRYVLYYHILGKHYEAKFKLDGNKYVEKVMEGIGMLLSLHIVDEVKLADDKDLLLPFYRLLTGIFNISDESPEFFANIYNKSVKLYSLVCRRTSSRRYGCMMIVLACFMIYFKINVEEIRFSSNLFGMETRWAFGVCSWMVPIPPEDLDELCELENEIVAKYWKDL